MLGANNFIMAPHCWIARFTPVNALPVARDLPISHIYGIKIPAAAAISIYIWSLYETPICKHKWSSFMIYSVFPDHTWYVRRQLFIK